MPKQTFFNLSEEKRKRIEKAALEEFANYPYLKSNINRIVENSKIAKGSFYQYFEDKKDLYKYLINSYAELKIEYMTKQKKKLTQNNFFEQLETLYILGIKFAREYPLFTKVSVKLIKGENEKLKREIFGESRAESEKFYQELILSAVENGEIDENFDLDFLSHLISSFSVDLIDYFFQEDYNSEENNFEEILDYLDQLIQILKNGLKK